MKSPDKLLPLFSAGVWFPTFNNWHITWEGTILQSGLKHWLLVLGIAVVTETVAQAPADSLPGNLVHTPGYPTAAWGSLSYQKVGNGKQPLLLLPGFGFDGSVFQDFARRNQTDYTMYLLTLPGYGSTRAYPMPPAGTSYGEGSWLQSVEQGILHLVDSAGLDRPVLVAHFLVASHIALQLAADHPGKFRKVVLIGAPAVLRSNPPFDTLGYRSRVRAVDSYMAPQWFRTVSLQTWRDGNFPPGVYSCDTLRGRELYEQANQAPLPVQIRYLCELWAADYAVYERVTIPVLALLPSFSPALLENPANGFLTWFVEEWPRLTVNNSRIRTVTVDGSACNIMNDRPDALGRLLAEFLKE